MRSDFFFKHPHLTVLTFFPSSDVIGGKLRMMKDEGLGAFRFSPNTNNLFFNLQLQPQDRKKHQLI